ncbi:MAG TPA: hypothetical protein VHD36_05845 [Pirellulales bacterium]|nr:hypothetical protein [Pirellulales bacterium]
MKSCHLLLLSAVSLILGCGDAASGPGASPPAATAGSGPPAPLPPAITPPPAAPVQEKASEDLTKKGIAAKEIGKGVLATPTSTYLRIQDRAIFLNLEHAMNLYKGEHGELPKSHEVFMRDIVQANNINLPELPDDSKYVYLPDKGELMIERRAMQ